MLEFIQSLFQNIDPMTGYVILMTSAYLENVIPPIPGDTVVVLGAYLVTIGQLTFTGVYISTTFGSVAGFLTMYYIGRKFGRSFIYKKTRAKIFKEKYIRKAERWYSRWGYWVIFANRFLSGTRSVISLFAGLFHLNAGIVSLLALLSAMIWNFILIMAGVLLGENWEQIAAIISRYNQIFLIALGVAVIYLLYRRIQVRRGVNGSEPS